MAIYGGSPSNADERSTGVDSSGRTSTHRLFANQIAFGELGAADRSDWYQLELQGAGVYQAIVSNDAGNNYSGNNLWSVAARGLTLSIVDAAGNTVFGVGLADTPANGDGSISFVFDGSPTAGLLYLRVENRAAEAADYVLTMRRTTLSGGTVTIDGTDGNDTLSGTSGSDLLRGGSGIDVLIGYAGNDVLDGGIGFDIAWYGYATQGVQVNLLAGLATIGGENDQLISVEGAYGSNFADILTGSSSGNWLVGLAGNDVINGGEGDDDIEGGEGNDVIDGGPGIDYVYYNNTRAEVRLTVDPATGQVLISTRSEGVDRARNIERIEFLDGAFDLPALVDLTAPSLVSFSPAANATNVAQNANIVVTFSEPVVVGRGTVTIRTTAGEVFAVYGFGSPNLRIDGNRLIIDPTGNLRGNTDYRIDFSAGAVTDALGNPFIGHTAYGFRTEPPRPEVSVASASAREWEGALRFTLTLSQPSQQAISLAVATDGSSTARAGSDFTAVSGTVTFAPGQTSATFSVPLLQDNLFEPSEAVYLLLGAPSGNALLANTGNVGYIDDDDATLPLPSDGLLGLQWHLYPGPGANVLPVWSQYTGAGVRVGIFDQGIDSRHPDLVPRLDLAAGRVAANPNARGGDPVEAGDNHGTAVAGVVAAARDGSGAVGVAYGATLVSFYSPLRGDLAPEIVNAYGYALGVDVLNDSWGFAPQYFSTAPWAFLDNFRSAEFAAAGRALQALADSGRAGLGTVVVQSAGNSFRFGDDTNLHNFQNSRYIVTVAATDINGRATAYSSPGASVLISAPGGGGDDRYSDIWTTDRVGSAGYASGSFTSITGTSFSSPLVAGVVALMLDANPSLGWRDVQQILAYSAVRTDVAGNTWRSNGAANHNGGGLHYDAVTHDHGFGLVDARAAVRLAESWLGPPATSANARELFVSRGTPEPIPDGSSQVAQTIEVAQDLEIERVEATIKITHTYVGDLSIKLTSPSGTESWLLNRPGQNALTAYGVAQDNIDFTFSTVLAAGENTRGTWTLTVYDSAALDSGRLDSWELVFLGKTDSADDVYFYSDEFSDAVAAQPARGTLRDTLGTDTLNAAMVTSASRIDLNPGATSTIDGVALRLAADGAIENAFGGDGNDTLLGSDAANLLFGMYGNDRIQGRGGNDRIDGGAGIDTAIHTGPRSVYTLQALAGGEWRVTDGRGIEGEDRLLATERIEFAGSFWALDTGPAGNAGKAAQVLRGLFGPGYATQPAFIGLGIALFDLGLGYEQIVGAAIGTPVFADLAGSRSNRDFVRLVYRNVVGVDPSAGELSSLAALLDNGSFTQTSLGVLACQLDVNALSPQLVGIANNGVEFVPAG